MISVIVLTKNEEQDISKCLDSLKWCDDIHILDSGSTDKTIAIASQYNVKVSNNEFKSFGQQRNHALDTLHIQNQWILFLDADEVCTLPFKEELLKAIRNAEDDVAGYYCCWKMMLENKWLKYCDNFPKWQFRIVRKGRARFTDFGHGQKEDLVVGEIRYIKEPYVHYGFSKGWFHWMARHNIYSSKEAEVRMLNKAPFKNIFSKHSSIRNPALKTFLSKLPGWPLLRFIQAYFFNFGFIEGIQGFIYCVNMGYYEFLIQIKMREIKQTGLANKKTNHE